MKLKILHPKEDSHTFSCESKFLRPKKIIEGKTAWKLEKSCFPLKDKMGCCITSFEKGMEILYFVNTFLEAISISSALTVFLPACIA